MKKLHLVTADTSLGSVNYGTELAPQAMLEGGLESLLVKEGFTIRRADPVGHARASGTSHATLRNAERLLPWLKELQVRLVGTNPDEVQLTLGGDHSVGAPSMLATKRRHADAVVVYVDAHPDAHALETTQTGNIHGLPIRIAAGQTLSQIFTGPYYQAHEICMVGIKDIDDAEQAWLDQQGIKYFHMDHVLEYGIGAVMNSVVEWADGRPLHVSYDIDAIDMEYAPGTGIRNQGGLSYREADYVARRLGGLSPVAVDLVEVNPQRDVDGKTLDLALELILKLLGAHWSSYERYLHAGQ